MSIPQSSGEKTLGQPKVGWELLSRERLDMGCLRRRIEDKVDKVWDEVRDKDTLAVGDRSVASPTVSEPQGYLHHAQTGLPEPTRKTLTLATRIFSPSPVFSGSKTVGDATERSPTGLHK
jgi:hypothetical protein